MAEELKTQGNEKLKAGDVEGAVSLYSSAIELEPRNHILYSNRSAAYMKLESWTLALADATRCTEIEPEWAKGYSRLGAAFSAMGEKAKAEAAFAKCRELGGTPAVPSAGGSGAAASSGATPAGAASQVGKVLMVARGFLMVNAVMLVVPGLGGGAFFRALLSAMACYTIELYQQHGTPSRDQAYMQRVVTDWRTHYLMAASLFAFAGTPRMLVLLPHVMAEVGYIAEAMLKYRPGWAAKIAPTLNSAVLPRLAGVDAAEWAALPLQRKWALYNQRVLDLNASLEVGIGLSLILELFTSSRNLLLLFAYWHSMRIRYMTSSQIREVFKQLDARILSLLGSAPMLQGPYGKLREFLASYVKTPTPEEAQRQQQEGLMGQLRQKCTIS